MFLMFYHYNYIIFILLWVVHVKGRDNIIIPNYKLSYTTLRISLYGSYGYVNPFITVKGIATIVTTELELENLVLKDISESIVIILPTFLFIKKRLISMILERIEITGIIVLHSNFFSENKKILFFNELPNCLLKNKMTCYSKNPDIYSDGYFFYKWKIPVILLRDETEYYNKLKKCYDMYNVKFLTDQRCMVEISNYYTSKMSFNRCILMDNSWQNTFWLVYKFEYCKVYKGYNIYITFNDVLFYKPKSIILIYIKTSTFSMFDTAAFGTQELYPTISSMIYMAKVFKEAAENNMLDPYSDILMTFLDNADTSEMGIIKLYYDLKTNKVSNAKQNISDKNIKLIISIEELSNAENTLTFITTKCEVDLCRKFKQTLIKFAAQYDIKLRSYDHSDYLLKFRIWESFAVPIIEIRSSLISNNLFTPSFLDMMKPTKIKFLINVSNTIATTLIEILRPNNNKKVDYNFISNIINPEYLALCLFNISCTYLQNIIGPEEKWWYEIFAHPFVAQSFSHEIISNKRSKYQSRLSSFILKLFVIILSQSRSSINDCKDFNNLRDFETTYNDVQYCFITKIQVETNFNLMHFMDIDTNDSIFSWMRISLYKKQRLMIYVSPDNTITNFLIVMYTIFIVLCLLGSIFIYQNINALILFEKIPLKMH